jgi:hypothetical protein
MVAARAKTVGRASEKRFDLARWNADPLENSSSFARRTLRDGFGGRR